MSSALTVPPAVSRYLPLSLRAEVKAALLTLSAVLLLVALSPAHAAEASQVKQSGKCKAIARWVELADRSAGAVLDDGVYDHRLVTYAYIDRVFVPSMGASFGSMSERQLGKLRDRLLRCAGNRNLMTLPLGRKLSKGLRRNQAYRLAVANEMSEWSGLIQRHNEFDRLSIDGRYEFKAIPVPSLRQVYGSERADDVMVDSKDVRRMFVPSVDQFNTLMILIDEVDTRAREAADSGYTHHGKRKAMTIKKDRFFAFRPNHLEIAQLDSLALIDHGLELVLRDYDNIRADLFEHGFANKEDFIAIARQTDHFIYHLRDSIEKVEIATWAGVYRNNLENADIDAAIKGILDRLAAAEARTRASILEGYKAHTSAFMQEMQTLQTEEQFTEYHYANLGIYYSGLSVGSKASRDSGLHDAFWDRKKALGLHPQRLIHRGWEANRQARERAQRQQEMEAAALVISILGTMGSAWLYSEPL